jgi:phosphonate transport system substrate-binding protein
MIVNASPRPGGLGRPAGFALLLLLVAGGIIAYVYMTNKPPEPADAGPGIRAYLEQQTGYLTLADGLTDKDEDLVADPPASGLINPETLLFCEINTADPNKDEERWKPFVDHLAKVTGKKVQYVKALDAPAEKKAEDGTTPDVPAPSSGALAALAAHVDALKAGRVHVTAFATGSVPAAVNKGGFVPMFCPGDANGKFGYEMEIVVRADSPIKTPADLKGKKLAFVGMTSNSGAKAPIVLLKDQFGLTAGRDYEFGWSGGHGKSLREVQSGGADAACVANDLLGAETAAGRVKDGELRSIYKSSTFPPLCFGVKHDLDPALVAKVKEAFASFNDLPAVYGKTPNRIKFAPVDYKRDWAYVIDIDKRLKGVAAK